ncbi:MAG TPA: AMP-dependent synthetase [Clostridiales bacterium]|nr:AMP-dependent synthetase [Clostridiales bacterium]
MKNYPLLEPRPIRDLKQMLDESAQLFADRPVFHAKASQDASYQPILYKTLKADVDALGTALVDLGLKDTRIALIGEHRFEWAVSYLGVVNGTGIIVPLDKELPSHEIRNMVERARTSAVIFSGKLAEKVAEAVQGNDGVRYLIHMDAKEDDGKILSFSRLVEKGRALLAEGNREFLDAVIDPDEMRIILFTSANTSKSKGAMLTHRNIASNLYAVSRMFELRSDDVMLSVLPIHHTYECTCGFLLTVYKGSSVAFCDGLKYIAKNMAEARPSVMLCVPLLLENMYRKIWESARKKGADKKLRIALKISNFLRKLGIDLRKKLFAEIHHTFGGRLRLMISGAAAVDPVVMKGLQDLGILAIQGYGLTECSPILTVNREFYYKDASCGLVIPCCEIRIDDPNDAGVGEIIARGENIMLGYYEDEEANQAAFKDGLFLTGDLGCFDKEGFLYITGRKKNVIITKNGKNVYPEEIEMLLNKSPYISESMVIGKDLPDEEDITLAAQVVPDMDAIRELPGGAELSSEQIRDMIWKDIKEINKNMVSYKRIKELVIRDREFEKTTTKKIKRYAEGNK